MSDTPNSDEFQNFCDAHFTDADLASVRKSKYEALLGMYECDLPFDPQFVISCLDDVHIRDALFRTFTDSFQIPLMGGEACLHDVHNKRVDFTDFLFASAQLAGQTAQFWATCAGFAALSGDMDSCRYAVRLGMESGFESHLGSLFLRTAELPNPVAHMGWLESVEQNTVDEYLAG